MEEKHWAGNWDLGPISLVRSQLYFSLHTALPCLTHIGIRKIPSHWSYITKGNEFFILYHIVLITINEMRTMSEFLHMTILTWQLYFSFQFHMGTSLLGKISLILIVYNKINMIPVKAQYTLVVSFHIFIYHPVLLRYFFKILNMFCLDRKQMIFLTFTNGNLIIALFMFTEWSSLL